MRIRLLVDSVDLTAYLLDKEWQIDSNAFGALDSVNFTLDDKSNALSLTRGKEVIIEDWADDTVRFFGGVLTEVTLETRGLGKRIQGKALDWTFLLDRALVNQTYRGKTFYYIISEAVASPKGIFASSDTDLSDFDYSAHVEADTDNTGYLQFRRDTIRDVLDTLGDMAGKIWYVDAFKKLHWQTFGVEGHSFWLSDDPDESASFPYYGLKQAFDITKVVNAVTVEGGFFRELYADLDEAARSIPSKGTSTKISALYLWQAREGQTRIQVYHNTNTDVSPTWVLNTVGLAGKDELGATYDCLWDPAARTLEFTTAPANLNKSVRIDGDRLRAVIGEEVNQPSIDTFARRYGYSIKDVTILSDQHAEMRASAELRKRAGEAERLSLRTLKDGVTSGKTLYLVNDILGISKNYLVEKVVTRLKGGTIAEYAVTLKAVA